MPDTVILTPANAPAAMHLLDPATGRILAATVDLVPNPDGSHAFVVWLDTDAAAGNAVRWEPTADRLRVNVNDGPVWNYPDTPGYGTMPGDRDPR